MKWTEAVWQLVSTLWRPVLEIGILTLAIYYATPWIRWDRGPYAPDQAVLVDLAHRRDRFAHHKPARLRIAPRAIVKACVPMKSAKPAIKTGMRPKLSTVRSSRSRKVMSVFVASFCPSTRYQ